MKPPILSLLFLLPITCLFSQKVTTSGDQSPAVMAQSLSVTYGVRADAVEAILWIYESEGYNENRRQRATEQILKEYAQSPEKEQKANALSEATRQKMGITDAPKVANALEWDLFARQHYLSTTGNNSPAVMSQGDVNIWYGIPPKALRTLAGQLEKNKIDLTNFEEQLAKQVERYEALKTELATYGSKEEIYRQAEALLEEGKLEEAEQLIESDFEASMKRQAYKGFIYGQTKELLLKYEEAAKGYRNAVDNDEGNSTYLLYYAKIEYTLAHYDEAIKYFEIALGIDSLENGNEESMAALTNNLGLAWKAKGAYDKAISYYEKALEIDLAAFEENHPKATIRYNNLGLAWQAKGDYDKAIEYFEKSLKIDLKVLGENHPTIAITYNNLGSAWKSKREYDKAIGYFEKAVQIFLKALGENHPKVATAYNNLGGPWQRKGKYDKAIAYYEKALQIDLKIFGENHPTVATRYNNLGSVWKVKGDYDKAIKYLEKALKINLDTLGENHPKIAMTYNNLGLVWYAKGENDKAIEYFDKSQSILDLFLESTHPSQIMLAQNLSAAANGKGMALNSEKKYREAIGFFKKAFSNAQKAEDFALALSSLKNIGATEKYLQQYEQGLEELDMGLQFAAQLHQEVDRAVKEQLTPEERNDPEVQAAIAVMKSLDTVRQMQYHKIGCLKGLNRHQEAEVLAQQLWQEGKAANDTNLLSDLKKEGYDFGE